METVAMCRYLWPSALVIGGTPTYVATGVTPPRGVHLQCEDFSHPCLFPRHAGASGGEGSFAIAAQLKHVGEASLVVSSQLKRGGETSLVVSAHMFVPLLVCSRLPSASALSVLRG